MYEELAAFNDEILVRIRFQVKQTNKEQIIKYSGTLKRIDGVSAASDPSLQSFVPFAYEFVVPAVGQAPRIAVVSCNDVNDDISPDTMWQRLLQTHEASSRHLLAQIGDQIYIDASLCVRNLGFVMENSRFMFIDVYP
jgi:hypothetical protein